MYGGLYLLLILRVEFVDQYELMNIINYCTLEMILDNLRHSGV